MSKANAVADFVHQHVHQSTVLTVWPIRISCVKYICSIDDHIAIETKIPSRERVEIVCKRAVVTIDSTASYSHIAPYT